MYFDPVETGKRIKAIREEKELSQMAFAEKINVSRSYMNKIENGTKSPSIDLLIEIAVFGKVTLDYLILGRSCDEEIEQKKNEIKKKIEIYENLLSEIKTLL